MNGIETRPTFYPLHRLPIYYSREKLEVAEKLGTSGICLPSFPKIKKKEIQYISNKINEFFNEV